VINQNEISLEPGKTALLLIDMQPYYIDSDEKKELIPNQVSVLRECFCRDIPIFVVEYDGKGRTDDQLHEVLDVNHSKGYYTITKSRDDAFSEAKLGNLLKKLKAESLVLMGINACACVFRTANSAVEKGYRIITSEDLIAGYCERCNEAERRAWYREHSVYLESHSQVIDLINGGSPA